MPLQGPFLDHIKKVENLHCAYSYKSIQLCDADITYKFPSCRIAQIHIHTNKNERLYQSSLLASDLLNFIRGFLSIYTNKNVFPFVRIRISGIGIQFVRTRIF